MVPTVERGLLEALFARWRSWREAAGDRPSAAPSAEELTGVGAQGLDVAALPFGVERVEREARFSRAARAREDDELALGDREVRDVEVVLARAETSMKSAHALPGGRPSFRAGRGVGKGAANRSSGEGIRAGLTPHPPPRSTRAQTTHAACAIRASLTVPCVVSRSWRVVLPCTTGGMIPSLTFRARAWWLMADTSRTSPSAADARPSRSPTARKGGRRPSSRMARGPLPRGHALRLVPPPAPVGNRAPLHRAGRPSTTCSPTRHVRVLTVLENVAISRTKTAFARRLQVRARHGERRRSAGRVRWIPIAARGCASPTACSACFAATRLTRPRELRDPHVCHRLRARSLSAAVDENAAAARAQLTSRQEGAKGAEGAQRVDAALRLRSRCRCTWRGRGTARSVDHDAPGTE